MQEIAILITFLIIFGAIYYKDRKDRERIDKILSVFDNTVSNVITFGEKTQNKFVDMASKIEMEHFKQLEKQSARMMGTIEKQSQTFLDAFPKVIEQPQVGSIDEIEKLENDIEKGPKDDLSLNDFPNIPIGEADNLKVQIEGEEEIFPIDFENRIT